jgi:hypothetical protein
MMKHSKVIKEKTASTSQGMGQQSVLGKMMEQ